MKYLRERNTDSENYLKKLVSSAASEIMVFNSLDSTNSYLKREARLGAEEGTIVIARHQSEGRGRLGRAFHSPEGTGLYMSFLLRPKIRIEDTLYITALAAVSVSEAIESVTGVLTGIKWVNDIYVNEKKVCGILTESSYNSTKDYLDFAVVGVGVDVFEPKNGFGDLSNIAGSLLPHSSLSDTVIFEIAAETFNRFMFEYGKLVENRFFEDYKKRLFVIGQSVGVIKNCERKEAVVLDIDKEYRLRVRYYDGREEFISSGEISIRTNSSIKFTE